MNYLEESEPAQQRKFVTDLRKEAKRLDNKRSYGTILVGKTKPEDKAPSPCVRYFIDKDGSRITEPEEYIPPENMGWLEPESYWSKEMEEKPMVKHKPTVEELRADQLVMNKAQAMKKYNCAKATIERWTREFGLPHWKQMWERGTETQNKAVLPSKGSPAIDSIPGDSPNDSEPNMEAQARMHTIPVEPEVLEEISTLDDIPFGEEPTEEERQIMEEVEQEEPGIIGQVYEMIEKCGIGVEALSDPDDTEWWHIEHEIKILYEHKVYQMNEAFKQKLRKILEGVGV